MKPIHHDRSLNKYFTYGWLSLFCIGLQAGTGELNWDWVHESSYSVIMGKYQTFQKSKAEEMSLCSRNYPVYIDHKKKNKVSSFTVLVGPFRERATAQNIRKELAATEPIQVEPAVQGHFFLQVMASGELEGALKQRDRLVRQLPGRTWVYKDPEDGLYKVWVGFYRNRAEAEKVKKSIDRKFPTLEKAWLRILNLPRHLQRVNDPRNESKTNEEPAGLEPPRKAARTQDAKLQWEWIGNVAYSVQLSANEKFQRSVDEAAELRELGYRPYLEPFRGTTRVRIGPFRDHLSAKSVKQELDRRGKETQIKIIESFPGSYFYIQLLATNSEQIALRTRNIVVRDLRKTVWLDRSSQYNFRVWVGFYQERARAEEAKKELVGQFPDCFIGELVAQ